MKKQAVTNPNNKKSLSLQFKIEMIMPSESLKTITFSSPEEQEEGNYKYWRSLTPEQRLELHYLLLVHVYSDEIEKNKNIPINEIVFCHDDIS